ncbi:cardiomyopathy-associated protein 5-like [Tiliqua scincoides]|uniref:cardiomyopathy-associated protein 5-like n=1 Tax=Tiliqua scincoides TaxID=71010 RepID=UPI003463521A
METDCNSEFGRSPEVSEEDEEEPQERGQLSNSLKNCNQDEVVKSKLSDSIGIVQDEDNGLTWEANSSRCSTSQASETSATSGVYSLENSYMDSPSEIDDGKFDRRRTNNSPNQEPLSPNRKIDPDRDYCVRQMQEKGEDTELDPANPKSWPYQVQPSKIKDYLVQITQEVVPSLQEEKDNALKKKGELPLEGTVRARIQLITAVLEERHKKIFRRVNKKDLPPPPPAPIIRRPREPPKIFSRQGIFVPLRHVEKEATDKNNKKELVHYNLKHVQTNVSNAGASVPNTVKKRTRRSFLSETQNKASEKLPSVSPPITDKANKSDIEPYSGLERASFTPTDHEDKMEKKERRSVLPDKDILEKACNLLDETKKPELQHYVPDTTVVTDISEESSSLPERTIAKPFTPVSVEPLSDSTNEPQNQFESTVTVLSDPTAQDKQPPNNFALMEHEPEQPILSETRNEDIEPHPSQPEIKDAAVCRVST